MTLTPLPLPLSPTAAASGIPAAKPPPAALALTPGEFPLPTGEVLPPPARPRLPEIAPRPSPAAAETPPPPRQALSPAALGSGLAAHGSPPAAPARRPDDYTDADLIEALRPLLGPAAAALPGGDPAFEAILRATFRRALSEHSSGPFDDPDLFHRSLWRLQALFTSRSYEDVVEQKLRRFRVEEVHLLDRRQLSLISFASADPVRHSNARRAEATSRRIALKIKDETGALVLSADAGHGRRIFVREGAYCYLTAIVRGEPDELVKADLDFALRRIESRFRLPFEQGAPLLRELQPFLEDCLLIHSPAAPIAA